MFFGKTSKHKGSGTPNCGRTPPLGHSWRNEDISLVRPEVEEDTVGVDEGVDETSTKVFETF